MCRFRNQTLRSAKARKIKRRPLPTVRVRNHIRSDLALYSIVIVIAVLTYVNSLNGEFVHDDIPAIVNNGDVTGENSLSQLLLNDFWGTPMADHNSHKSYRPLTTLSFRLNYILSGLQPWWWHASNIMLHAICCALVARACISVAKLQRPFAGLAAALFAIHPIHTEAVAGVVGRADVLACIFFLISLLVYNRPTNSKKYVWLSIVLGALSMLAKETGITILGLNFAMDVYRYWPVLKTSILAWKLEKKCLTLSRRLIKIFISAILLVCLRLAMLQGSWPSFTKADNPAAFHSSFLVRFMSFCYLASLNLWLLICPWTLSHDWQMSSVPLILSGWDQRNLLTCAAFGAMTLLCYRCVSDFQAHKHTPAVTGFFLMTISFIPASNLLITVGFVIAERVLYIPSVGSVIITAYGAQVLWSKPQMKTFVIVGLAFIAACGVARTYRRNSDWMDRGTLLKADIVTLPQNAKLHYNLANFLRENNEQENAIQHYREALRLWPTYASAHNNLGTLLAATENSETYFLDAIKYNQFHANAHYNLAKIYKNSGRPNKAISMLEMCVWLEPSFLEAWIDLLHLLPDLEKQALLRRLIKTDPKNWQHYMLFGEWFRNKQLYGPASRLYLEATRLSLKYPQSYTHFRADLMTLRTTALMYRGMGQKSRILQLITRYHSWRRGWPSPAATHLHLREWKLKIELEKKAQIYIKAAKLKKSTTCVDHSQLSIDPPPEDASANVLKFHRKKYNDKVATVKKINAEDYDTSCGQKSTGTKKSKLSIQSQVIKTTHNKSDVGMKEKQCKTRLKETADTNKKIEPKYKEKLQPILMKVF